MKSEHLEQDLRTLLRNPVAFPGGTVTFTEYARGGDDGVPDCWIAGPGRWAPVELKRGKVEDITDLMRPSQRRWHRDSLQLDIQTYLMTLHENMVYGYHGVMRDNKLVMNHTNSWSVTDLSSGFNYFTVKTWISSRNTAR